MDEVNVNSDTLELCIANPSGERMVAFVALEDTLQQIKGIITKEWDIPEAQQKLLIDGSVIDDLSHVALDKSLGEILPNPTVDNRLEITVEKRPDEEARVLRTLFMMRGEELVSRTPSMISRRSIKFVDRKAWTEVPEHLNGSLDIMKFVVRIEGQALSWAAPELKGHRELVLEAIANDGLALQYATRELREDRPLVLAAVAVSGRALEHTSLELQDDKELVLVAVANDGWALEFASRRLKRDKDVVSIAVAQNRDAVECASKWRRAVFHLRSAVRQFGL